MQNVFTASVDTSSMMWAMVELNRCRTRSMRRVGGKDRVPLDDMPKLRHLKWVVKETLRCTRSCHTCCPGSERASGTSPSAATMC